MRLLSGLAWVVALALLAGCGSAAVRSGSPRDGGAQLAAAPPIQAVDEAPPPALQEMLKLELAPPPADFGQTSSTSGSGQAVTFMYAWSSGSAGVDGATARQPTPEELAQLRTQMETRYEHVVPAPDSPPRVVARLALHEGGEALFAAWHNGTGQLCTVSQLVDTQGGGGGGVDGPCQSAEEGGPPCTAALCLSSDGSGSSPADERFVLSGTVAADADVIDVATTDGTTTEYPLTGPLVDGDQRVFMLELGTTDWRTLTLLRGGEVEATETMPALQAAAEDCDKTLGEMPMPTPQYPPPGESGPVPPTPEQTAWNDRFQACIRATGALSVVPPAPLVAPYP